MTKKNIVIICSKQITKHADHYLAELFKKKNKYYIISIIANISSTNSEFYRNKYKNYFNEIIQEPDEFKSISKKTNNKDL